jgi:hypothetical protein
VPLSQSRNGRPQHFKRELARRRMSSDVEGVPPQKVVPYQTGLGSRFRP